MSIEAVHWALDVPVSGNAKVVLIGIANHAGPDGSGSFPALDTLAEYAFCDRSTARRNLRKLEAEGWIEMDGHGPRGQPCWRLVYARKGWQNATGHTPGQGGGKMPPLEANGVAFGVANGVAFGVAPVPPEPTTNNQQGDKSPISVEKGDVVECFAYWQERCNHPDAKLTPERARKIKSRRGDGYTVDNIRRAIDGAARAPFIDDSGKRFDDIELICRNGSKLESFMLRAEVNLAAAPVVPITRAPHLERMDAWKRGYPAEGSA